MPSIGRKIYYELATGNVIVDTGERTGDVVETTTEQDFETYASLTERVPESVGSLQLEFGQYRDDFTLCNGYRVDVSVEPHTLLFSYPTGDEEPVEPEIPLTDVVEQLKQQIAQLQEEIDALKGGV